MSAPAREESQPIGVFEGRSLKDELSSLKIDRKTRSAPKPAATNLGSVERGTAAIAPARRPRGSGSVGLRLLSLLLWIIPIGLIGGGGYFAYEQYRKAQPKLKVTLESVSAMTTGEAGRILTAKGYIRSFQQAKIGAMKPGRIARLFVKEGMRVNAGDPIAELEHTEFDAQLTSRKASLARSESELNEARVDLQFKEIKSKRAQRLRERGQVSNEEAEDALSAFRMAEERVRTLEAAIEVQKAQIGEIETAIRDMTIFAPFAGTVLEKAAEVGETIMLGGLGAASGRGSVVTLADLDDLEVETDIEENALGKLKDPKLFPNEKQFAEIQVLAFPEMRYLGVLDRVVPLGDRARGTVKVYVKIKNPDARLFPELVANVSFLREGSSASTGMAETSLYISSGSVVKEGDQTFAWVVDSENIAHKREIRVTFEKERARVESGLKANERVVTNPDSKLSDGMLVAVAT